MDLRSKLATVLLLLLIVTAPLARAAGEEEDFEEEGGFGDLVLEAALWVAQPAGLEYYPASERDPTNAAGTTLLSPVHGTADHPRYRIGYALSKNLGTFLLTWFAHRDEEALERLSPGQFIYYELQPSRFAGFKNDRLSDGFKSSTETVLRDLRLDFQRQAFETRRVSGTWSVGWRRVQHKRKMRTEYFGLLPPLPPIIAPFTGTDVQRVLPMTDTAQVQSEYEGRGLSGGMDFLVPVFRDKLVIEAGFNVAVLRGKAQTSYLSFTHYYTFCPDGVTDCSSDAILVPSADPDIGYAEFGETYFASADNPMKPKIEVIDQENFTTGLQGKNVSTSSDVIDTYLGLRWKAWRELEVFVGFRSTRYANVGTDLVPLAVSTNAEDALVDEFGAVTGGVDEQNLREVDRSATYEGIYGGIGYRF